MKILICDDDSISLRMNKALVEEFIENRNIRDVSIVTYRKIVKEEKNCNYGDVDIALLDIDLQDEVNGIKIAKQLKKSNPYIILIFITNYDSYALDAWKIQAFGFLQKPVAEEEFNRIFARALLQLNGLHITRMNRMIQLSNKDVVREKQIFCIEKIGGTKDIRVTTNKDVFVVRGTLKEMQNKLSNSFVRINRTVIVNMLYIFKMKNDVIELSNGKVFSIALSKEKEIGMALKKQQY